MSDEKLRLGGMALSNGVLIHGPTAWACAVRTRDGKIAVASGKKRIRGAEVEKPLLRGPLRLLEALVVLPAMRRRLPEARFPFERPVVGAAMLASALAVRLVRESRTLGAATRELVSGLLSVVPAAVALRGSELAGYHGAEHVVVGTYEHGSARPKEHERCGSHLLGPLLMTTAVARMATSRVTGALAAPARAAASLAAIAAATEIFGWMVRNPDEPLSKALAKPGHELQCRFATAEPTAAQLEVAQAALDECLRLEAQDRK